MTVLGRVVKITGIVVGGVAAILVAVVWAAGYFLFGAFHDNKAQDAAAPITRVFSSLGAQQLCDDGDAGFGPDNDLPWYDAYYRVSDEAVARKAIFSAAAASGHPLFVDPNVHHQGAEDRSYTSNKSDNVGLQVEILRDGTFDSGCFDKDHYEKLSTSGKGAIIDFEYYSAHR
jgi:hypothetical protein